jgi:hypothetical protein
VTKVRYFRIPVTNQNYIYELIKCRITSRNVQFRIFCVPVSCLKSCDKNAKKLYMENTFVYVATSGSEFITAFRIDVSSAHTHTHTYTYTHTLLILRMHVVAP